MTTLKRITFEMILAQGDTGVFVRVNAQTTGLPFDEGQILMLKYRLGEPENTRDLVVNDDGIAATLSFNNRSAATFVPWEAVAAVVAMDKSFTAQWTEAELPGTKLRLVS